LLELLQFVQFKGETKKNAKTLCIFIVTLFISTAKQRVCDIENQTGHMKTSSSSSQLTLTDCELSSSVRALEFSGVQLLSVRSNLTSGSPAGSSVSPPADFALDTEGFRSGSCAEALFSDTPTELSLALVGKCGERIRREARIEGLRAADLGWSSPVDDICAGRLEFARIRAFRDDWWLRLRWNEKRGRMRPTLLDDRFASFNASSAAK